MVGYLYAAALPYGIVVQVDIGALVEAVVRGLLGWRGDVVVDVCEAGGGEYVSSMSECGSCLQCQKRHLALLWRHIARLAAVRPSGFQDI